jgi:hypothetical protein
MNSVRYAILHFSLDKFQHLFNLSFGDLADKILPINRVTFLDK